MWFSIAGGPAACKGFFVRGLPASRWNPALGRLRPDLVRTDWRSLVHAQAIRVDGRIEEVLGREWTPAQSPQERELAGMRHGIGKGPLEQSLGDCISKVARAADGVRQFPEQSKESVDLGFIRRTIRQD